MNVGGSSVDRAVVGRAFRQARTPAVVWALAFGGTVATTAMSYASSFPDQASRTQLAVTTQGQTGLSMLLGPTAAIDTVGGYTVYKCFVFLTVVGAIWGLLATTRLLRGEEDAGRWQLILAGGTSAPRALVSTLVALGTAVVVIVGATVAFTVAAGRDPEVGFGVGDSVVFGLSIAIVLACFVAIGALTSQLGRTRRMATGLGMAVFGLSFVLRMVADSGPRTRWLLWFTPFGWSERMRPFTENDARPLVLAAVVVAALVAVSTWVAAHRDAGTGVIAARDIAPPRRFGLRSPLGLALRIELPILVAWAVGVAMAAFAFGMVSKLTTGSVPAALGDAMEKFGVRGTLLRQYFGVAFLLVATIVALLPAGQLGAAADEEASTRLGQVLAQPTRRARLLVGRLLLAAVAVVVTGLLGGTSAWLGARSQGVDAGLGEMLGAGLNVVPTALVALGVGAVVLAVAPRAASLSVHAVVVGSLVVDLLSSMATSAHWLDRASLFHYMALAPAAPATTTTTLITLVIAVGLGAVATWLFGRRDLHPG